MKTLRGQITSASFAAGDNGQHEDRTRINVRFQPAPRTEQRPDPTRRGRLVSVDVEKFPAIAQTVDIGCVKARHKKLSELCGQDMTVELDESGAIRSVAHAS